MSVTEAGTATALNSDVSLRANVAVELGTLIAVYATHCDEVTTICI